MSRRSTRFAIVVGTRPEAIKLSCIVKEFRQHASVEVQIILTSQHPDLARSIFSELELEVDSALRPTVSVTLDGRLLEIGHGLRELWYDDPPDVVIVQGDTTSALAAALVAQYLGIKVWHVEAGLRTFDFNDPFPEEINRVWISRCATLHFTATPGNRQTLLDEGIDDSRIAITGNPGIDALRLTIERLDAIQLDNISGHGESLAVVTLHRRENIGPPLRSILDGLLKFRHRWPEVKVMLPLHPNPNVQALVREHPIAPLIHVIDPLPYVEFVQLLMRSTFVVTDSGGIEEEVTFLDKPALFVRNKTERSEALAVDRRVLIGTSAEAVYRWCNQMMQVRTQKSTAPRNLSVFGDGHSANRLWKVGMQKLGLSPVILRTPSIATTHATRFELLKYLQTIETCLSRNP